MTTAISPKLARLIRNIGKAIVMRFAGGPFPTTEYIAELERELKRYNLNHPEFISEIARTFVRFDLAERARHDPFKVNPDTGQLDVALFAPADFAKGIIRLGNGLNVRMADATARQWVARIQHQQRAAEAAQQAAKKTTQFLQTKPGVMLFENPPLKTCEARGQLHLWDIDDAVREDEDDDGPAVAPRPAECVDERHDRGDESDDARHTSDRHAARDRRARRSRTPTLPRG